MSGLIGRSTSPWAFSCTVPPCWGSILALWKDLYPPLPEQGYSAVVMCIAGYRAKDDKHVDLAKVRDKTEVMVQIIDSCIDLIEVDLTEDTGS